MLQRYKNISYKYSMSYPEFHHIGFKIISTYFMYITINQNRQKIQDLQKIKLLLEYNNIKR